LGLLLPVVMATVDGLVVPRPRVGRLRLHIVPTIRKRQSPTRQERLPGLVVDP